MLHSESYNKKRDRGEHEKSLAKMKLADAYFVDALKILLGQIENDKLHFGRVAEENLKIDISHYEEIKWACLEILLPLFELATIKSDT